MKPEPRRSPPPRLKLPRNDSGTSAGISIEWSVEPGSLPRLRFGHGYRVRARAVDLAGHVVAFDAAPIARRARRPEPRLPPLRASACAHPRLGTDRPARERGRVERPHRHAHRQRERVARRSSPAAVASGSSSRRARPWRSSRPIAGSTTGAGLLRPTPRGAARSRRRDADRASREEGHYRSRREIIVPYIPDPFARGARSATYRERRPARPLGTGDVQDEWPAPVGLRFALEAGDGPPDWDATSRVLTVQLRRAPCEGPVQLLGHRGRPRADGHLVWLRDWVDELQTSDPTRRCGCPASSTTRRGVRCRAGTGC